MFVYGKDFVKINGKVWFIKYKKEFGFGNNSIKW